MRIAHFDVADLVTADAERRAQSAENAADGPFLIVPPLGDANGKSLAAEPCPFRADAAPLAVEAWTGAPFTADRGALAALVKLALERVSQGVARGDVLDCGREQLGREVRRVVAAFEERLGPGADLRRGNDLRGVRAE